METLNLIQISDFHLPETLSTSPIVDWTDDGFPCLLAKTVGASHLKSVMRELVAFIENNKDSIGGIIICGDLTTKGNLDGYDKCLNYLNDNIQLASASNWQADQVHVVPGNHDIDRDKCDPSHKDLYLKFDPLIVAWHNLGLPVLTARGVRQTQMSAKGYSVDVFSLNSCIGCGEQRSMPSKIKQQLHDLIKMDLDADLVWEQLDTPAFSEEDVNEIASKISRISHLSVGIVVAHHNLLPQVCPRLEIYTEVINGGLVRSRFSQCGQPVIYCHGHVHEDPIEVIVNPRSGRGRLISVSCSKFTDGFNVIKLHFSRSDIPLGCTVVPYRFKSDGSVKIQDSIIVPLRTVHDAGLIIDEVTRAILSCVKKDWIRFDDIRNALDDKLRRTPQRRTLAHALKELEWLGCLEIIDSDEDMKHWQIRRTES